MQTDYLMLMESSEVTLEEMGAQALTTAAYQLPDAVLKDLDAVTLDNVVKVKLKLESPQAPVTPPLRWCFAVYSQKFLNR